MSTVIPIRRGFRVRKTNHDNDTRTINFANLSRHFGERAAQLAMTEPGSERHRLALHMIGIDHKLPRNNLRCIHSTLDEQRDFELRCREAEVAKAEQVLEACRLDQLRTIEGEAWQDTDAYLDRLGRVNDLWAAYRACISLLARTPARSRWQLDRKRSTIGKVWLAADGEWYDELRAGVAADEAWLSENMPAKRRRG